MPNSLADSSVGQSNNGSMMMRVATATRRVLIIEDDKEIRNVIAIRMQHAGFRTVEAIDGVTGLGIAMRGSIDAILLDIRLPSQSGLAVLAQLKQSDFTRHIPVVVVSASVGDKEYALKHGASFFVDKPFDARDLVSAVSAAIDQCEWVARRRIDSKHELPLRGTRQ